MTGQEALERLTLHARADIADVLGPNDPISKLPPDVRACIRSVKPTLHGRVIELYDSQRATELLGKASGLFTEKVEHSGKLTLLEEALTASRQTGASDV